MVPSMMTIEIAIEIKMSPIQRKRARGAISFVCSF
jgi:hypothetical protein